MRTTLQTCRMCKKTNFDTSESMVKYGVRHYIHPTCGFEKFGPDFLQKLSLTALGSLPFMLLERLGLTDAARAAMGKVTHG